MYTEYYTQQVTEYLSISPGLPLHPDTIARGAGLSRDATMATLQQLTSLGTVCQEGELFHLALT